MTFDDFERLAVLINELQKIKVLALVISVASVLRRKSSPWAWT